MHTPSTFPSPDQGAFIQTQILDLHWETSLLPGSFFLGNLPALQHSDFLHPNESARYHTYPDGPRKKSFLAGRYAAKSALALLNDGMSWPDVEIASGVLNQPVVLGVPQQVSIAHCGDWAAAVAFPEEHPLGVDIEQVGARLPHLKKLFLTPAEMTLVSKMEAPEEQALTMFWTLKEALSKVLKTGLTIPLEQLEVSAIQRISTGWEGQFSHFSSFKGLCFEVPHSDIMGALVLPRNTEIHGVLT